MKILGESQFGANQPWEMHLMTKLLLKRWGNSLAVRIPAALAQEVHFEEDQEVDVYVEGDRLVVAAADELFTWERYNEQLNAMNRPIESLIDFGGPVGSEAGSSD